MLASITRHLSAEGVPVEKCPNCATAGWDFHGDTERGITTVICRECERTYRLLAWHEEIELHARAIVIMAQDGDFAGADEYTGLLAESTKWFRAHPAIMRRFAVARGGIGTEDGDDCPF